MATQRISEYTPITDRGGSRPGGVAYDEQRTRELLDAMDYQSWKAAHPEFVERLEREERARRRGGNGGTPPQPAASPLRAASVRRLVEVTPGGYRPAAAPSQPQLTHAQAMQLRHAGYAALHALRRAAGLPPEYTDAGPNERYDEWAERSGAHHVLIPGERFDGPPAAGPEQTYGEWAAAARKWHVQP